MRAKLPNDLTGGNQQQRRHLFATSFDCQGHERASDETDPRLVGYRHDLIALHCNTCEYINDNATGFKFAILPSEVKTIDCELDKCLSEHYKDDRLKYHYQTTSNEI